MHAERGQALIVALGAMFVVLLGAGVLAALGGALAQKGRLQRARITFQERGGLRQGAHLLA
jgi:ABC-type transporter Mla subunit MlaD